MFSVEAVRAITKIRTNLVSDKPRNLFFYPKKLESLADPTLILPTKKTLQRLLKEPEKMTK